MYKFIALFSVPLAVVMALACGGMAPGPDADPSSDEALAIQEALSEAAAEEAASGFPALTDEDRAGQVFAPGDRVKAVRSKMRSPLSATFKQQYGKIAQLRFSDANTGWVLVKAIDPPGAITAHPPTEDRCDAAVGDEVMAPWSTSYSKFKGRVGEVYGRMAFIAYADGELDWAACDQLEPVPVAAPAPAGGAGQGTSDAVSRCQRGCHKQCKGASNTSKCVGQCRRACAG